MKSALSHSVFVVICDTFTLLSSLFIPLPSPHPPPILSSVFLKREKISEFSSRQLRMLKVMNLYLSGFFSIVGSNWSGVHLYSKMPVKPHLNKTSFFPLFCNTFFIGTVSFYFH